jgi:hypothetical protein
VRNLRGLTEYEVRRCQIIWEVLGGNEWCALNISEADQHSSQSRFNEGRKIVFLGADVEPGVGTDARSRMSALACLAHELAHVQRYERGYRRALELPDKLIDEAEASICMPTLYPKWYQYHAFGKA